MGQVYVHALASALPLRPYMGLCVLLCPNPCQMESMPWMSEGLNAR